MTISSRPSFAADISAIEVWRTDYDLILVALGYEQRSRHLACSYEGRASRKLAIPFEDDRVCSYSENLAQLRDRGYAIVDIPEFKVPVWWRDELAEAQKALGSERPLHICIDISSLTRLRLANLVEGLVSNDSGRPVIVDFVYTVAQFSPPSTSSEAATVCGPVSTFLAGWPSDPDKSVAAIIGLGYELEKAVGALEYMEPAARMLVKPISKDHRFDEEVELANRQLLRSENPSEIFSYPIDQPTQCLELLDALIHGLKDDFRLIAIPFGPKIFALCCMLVACRYYPEIGVWRISAEASRSARDQLPSNTTVGLRVRFDPRLTPSTEPTA